MVLIKVFPVLNIKLNVLRVFKVNQFFFIYSFLFDYESFLLLAYLTNLGYSVSTHQIPIRNVCEVHVYDLKVFECDIRNLQFGGDGELDDLCHEALQKITDVTSPS